VPAKEEAAGNHLFQGGESVPQTSAIPSGISRTGRAKRSRLAVWQIATQHGEAVRAKSFRERHEERRRGARARAVRQNEAVAVGIVRQMEKSTNFGLDGAIAKLATGGLRQDLILNRREIRHYLANDVHELNRDLLTTVQNFHVERCRR
jgi:hypothetical protein